MGESDRTFKIGLVQLHELIAETIKWIQKGEYTQIDTTPLPSEEQKIGEVSTYIKNTSEKAITAAASTEQASAATDQISHIVTNLNGIVDSVSHEVNKFKV